MFMDFRYTQALHTTILKGKAWVYILKFTSLESAILKCKPYKSTILELYIFKGTVDKITTTKIPPPE